MKALQALEIARAFDAEEPSDSPDDQKTLQQRFVEAELYHARDESNMRVGKDHYVAHNVLCFIFEDGSRLVKFIHWTSPFPEVSDWAAIPAASSLNGGQDAVRKIDETTIEKAAFAGELLIRAAAVLGTLTPEQQNELSIATEGKLPEAVVTALNGAKAVAPSIVQSLKTHPPTGLVGVKF